MLATITITAFLLSPSIAVAQDDGLALARVCAREAGLSSYRSGDCVGIYRVLRRVGRGSVSAGAEAYAAHSKRSIRRNPWIVELNRDISRPPSWPSRLSWVRHARHWLALLRLADRLVEHGSPPGTCRPHHWGDRRGDLARAQAAGFVPVNCGRTHNLFWRDPRIGR